MLQNKPVILIVDDVPENVQILGALLSESYSTFFALDGNEALEQAEILEPDLILLDVMMPVMDGYEVCRRLKNNEKFRDTPIIFITALDLPEEESAGLKLGAADYITKPFNQDLVLLRIRNHLQLKLQRDLLIARAVEMEAAMARIKVLSGIIPICSSCKKIRDDAGYWQQVEEYISKHSEAEFSHGICNDCVKKLYPEYYDVLTSKNH
jgi:CheY-like chemotaxis protein